MENTTTQLHDFGDGNGPVQSHRHVNPDGCLGCWVPDVWDINPHMYVFLNTLEASHRPKNVFYVSVDEIIVQGVSAMEKIDVSFEIEE